MASLRLPGVDHAGAVEVVFVYGVVVAIQLAFGEVCVDDTVDIVSDELDAWLSAQDIAEGSCAFGRLCHL